MSWSDVFIKIGVELVPKLIGQVVDYALASEERRAEMRAQAEEDTVRAYDIVDNHLLRNNAIVDAEADAKFGPAAAASRDTAESEQDAAATGRTAARDTHGKDGEG